MAKINKETQGNDNKVLKGIEFILNRLDAQAKATDKQFSIVRKDLSGIKSEVGTIKSEVGTIKSEVGTIKSELESVKIAVIENNVNIRELKLECKGLKQSVDVAVTNHESRIRRLEEKVGV